MRRKRNGWSAFCNWNRFDRDNHWLVLVGIYRTRSSGSPIIFSVARASAVTALSRSDRGMPKMASIFVIYSDHHHLWLSGCHRRLPTRWSLLPHFWTFSFNYSLIMARRWSDYEPHKILKRVREIDAVSTSALVPWIRPKAPAFLSKTSHFVWVFKSLKRIN